MGLSTTLSAMSRAVKMTAAAGLMAVLLGACGVAAKPQAGSPVLARRHVKGFYGVIDDPRVAHMPCLRTDKLHPVMFRAQGSGLPAIQIGRPRIGPTIIFYPTPGIAQGLQIQGHDEGAEVIGSALLFPNHASDSLLSEIETCTALGVTG